MANLSQNREVSSTSHPTPPAFKDPPKQDQGGNTHFVSLPLAIYPELQEKLESFKNSVLGNNDKNQLKFQGTLAAMGIDETIFAKPNSFHLTVVMLKLGNKESMDKAQEIFKQISPDVSGALKNRPVYITLKGLESMTGPLETTSILYAPVEEVGNEGLLQKACDVIIDAFVKVGLAVRDPNFPLKLHVTVMNAIYRKDPKKKKDPFDAREIHEKFGKKDWGTYKIREAHISERSNFDPKNGYFHCCASLPFPQQ